MNNDNISTFNLPSELVDWAQCDICKKWRRLPKEIDPNTLPEKWVCTMNSWDPNYNHCFVDEEIIQPPTQPTAQPTAQPTLSLDNNLQSKLPSNVNKQDKEPIMKASRNKKKIGTLPNSQSHPSYSMRTQLSEELINRTIEAGTKLDNNGNNNIILNDKSEYIDPHHIYNNSRELNRNHLDSHLLKNYLPTNIYNSFKNWLKDNGQRNSVDDNRDQISDSTISLLDRDNKIQDQDVHKLIITSDIYEKDLEYPDIWPKEHRNHQISLTQNQLYESIFTKINRNNYRLQLKNPNISFTDLQKDLYNNYSIFACKLATNSTNNKLTHPLKSRIILTNNETSLTMEKIAMDLYSVLSRPLINNNINTITNGINPNITGYNIQNNIITNSFPSNPLDKYLNNNTEYPIKLGLASKIKWDMTPFDLNEYKQEKIYKNNNIEKHLKSCRKSMNHLKELLDLKDNSIESTSKKLPEYLKINPLNQKYDKQFIVDNNENIHGAIYDLLPFFNWLVDINSDNNNHLQDMEQDNSNTNSNEGNTSQNHQLSESIQNILEESNIEIDSNQFENNDIPINHKKHFYYVNDKNRPDLSSKLQGENLAINRDKYLTKELITENNNGDYEQIENNETFELNSDLIENDLNNEIIQLEGLKSNLLDDSMEHARFKGSKNAKLSSKKNTKKIQVNKKNLNNSTNKKNETDKNSPKLSEYQNITLRRSTRTIKLKTDTNNYSDPVKITTLSDTNIIKSKRKSKKTTNYPLELNTDKDQLDLENNIYKDGETLNEEEKDEFIQVKSNLDTIKNDNKLENMKKTEKKNKQKKQVSDNGVKVQIQGNKENDIEKDNILISKEFKTSYLKGKSQSKQDNLNTENSINEQGSIPQNKHLLTDVNKVDEQSIKITDTNLEYQNDIQKDLDNNIRGSTSENLEAKYNTSRKQNGKRIKDQEISRKTNKIGNRIKKISIELEDGEEIKKDAREEIEKDLEEEIEQKNIREEIEQKNPRKQIEKKLKKIKNEKNNETLFITENNETPTHILPEKSKTDQYLINPIYDSPPFDEQTPNIKYDENKKSKYTKTQNDQKPNQKISKKEQQSPRINDHDNNKQTSLFDSIPKLDQEDTKEIKDPWSPIKTINPSYDNTLVQRDLNNSNNHSIKSLLSWQEKPVDINHFTRKRFSYDYRTNTLPNNHQPKYPRKYRTYNYGNNYRNSRDITIPKEQVQEESIDKERLCYSVERIGAIQGLEREGIHNHMINQHRDPSSYGEIHNNNFDHRSYLQTQSPIHIDNKTNKVLHTQTDNNTYLYEQVGKDMHFNSNTQLIREPQGYKDHHYYKDNLGKRDYSLNNKDQVYIEDFTTNKDNQIHRDNQNYSQGQYSGYSEHYNYQEPNRFTSRINHKYTNRNEYSKNHSSYYSPYKSSNFINNKEPNSNYQNRNTTYRESYDKVKYSNNYQTHYQNNNK